MYTYNTFVMSISSLAKVEWNVCSAGGPAPPPKMGPELVFKVSDEVTLNLTQKRNPETGPPFKGSLTR